MYIKNGKRTNDDTAFSGSGYFIIPLYGVCAWSNANCCRKPKYFIGCVDTGIYDFIWAWIAEINKQKFILSLECRGSYIDTKCPR